MSFHLPDQRRIAGVPGPAPHADRDAVPGDGHADHDLGQVVAVVLGLAGGAEPRGLAVLRVIAASGVTVLVAGGRGVGLLCLEVGGGRVKEEQVHLKVEQVRDLTGYLPPARAGGTALSGMSGVIPLTITA
jgi:hypothetical protein